MAKCYTFCGFKHVHSAKVTDRAIRMGRKQADHVLLDIVAVIEKGALIDSIKNRVARSETIISIFIIWQDKLFRFSREEVLDGKIDSKIQWGGSTDAASCQ